MEQEKKYIIKISNANSDSWTYVKEIYARPNDEKGGDYTATFSFCSNIMKEHAMVFKNMEEVQMVFNYINAYGKRFRKVYKLEIEEV